MNEEQLQAARIAAIKRVGVAKLSFWVCLVMTGTCEVFFLGALLWEVDWQDPTQRLLMIATGLVYGTLGMAVTALGAYNRLWALRIVQAIQLGPAQSESPEK
jgi:drug/metabolite transporter (DMT)-like permease